MKADVSQRAPNSNERLQMCNEYPHTLPLCILSTTKYPELYVTNSNISVSAIQEQFSQSILDNNFTMLMN